jgi:hypothetical protein
MGQRLGPTARLETEKNLLRRCDAVHTMTHLLQTFVRDVGIYLADQERAGYSFGTLLTHDGPRGTHDCNTPLHLTPFGRALLR